MTAAEAQSDEERCQGADGDAPGEGYFRDMLFPGSRERNEAGQNGYDDEACRHGKDVAGVVAPGAGQHSQQEDAKHGSVRVAEDAESNPDDALRTRP